MTFEHPAQNAREQNFEFHTFEFIDLVHIEGKPNVALSGQGIGLGQISLSCFTHWHKALPVSWALHLKFDVKGRTLFLGASAGIQWYIVMNPLGAREQVSSAGKGTSMSAARAGRVMQLVLKVLIMELPHLGFNELNYRERLQNGLTSRDFRVLQQSMIERWQVDIVQDAVDEFWNRHEPSLHCIMVGHNLEIGEWECDRG